MNALIVGRAELPHGTQKHHLRPPRPGIPFRFQNLPPRKCHRRQDEAKVAVLKNLPNHPNPDVMSIVQALLDNSI